MSYPSHYDARTFNLAANTPQALPPARNYVLLSASVNPDAVGFSVGDNNGDTALWPIGIEIMVRGGKTLPARVSSSVAQSVTVLMVDGDIEVRDNRPIIQPYTARFRVISAPAAPQTNTTVVPAATNVNGIELQVATLCCNAGIARASLGDNTNFFADAMGLQAISISERIIIPAGSSLLVQTTDDARVSGAYRIL